MYWFNPNPGRINSIEPGKRQLNNQAETVVLRDGEPFMALGLPGGRKIPTSVTLMLLYVLDYGMGVKAVEAPRFHCEDREPILVEYAWLDLVPRVYSVRRGLEAMGHRVEVGYGPFMAGGPYISGPASMVLIDHESGKLRGSADPRQPGAVGGY